MNVVFDAGALIAIERGDRAIWSVAKATIADQGDILIPSTVVAQVWRGTRRQANLSRVLAVSVVAAFDPLAERIGELCGRAKRSDICDAHVAWIAAAATVVAVYTSDPDDIAHLLATLGVADRTVRC